MKTNKMTNQLIPLTRCSDEPDVFEPTLVNHGFQYRQLVKAPTMGGTQGGYHTKHDHQGFSWRHDLDGKVRRCGGMPVIQLDDGGLFAVNNANTFIRACWGK